MAKSPKKSVRKKKPAKSTKPNNDAAVLKMAEKLPAGGAKKLTECVLGIEDCRERKRAITREEKEFRNIVKGDLKIELRHFDEVLKQRRMEPEDRAAYIVGTALIKEQLGMELREGEKAALKEQEAAAEKQRKALMDAHGGAGNAGKEVGSGVAKNPAAAGDEKEATPIKASMIPQRNESLSTAYN